MPETNVSGSGILFQFTACLLECAPIILVDLHGGERERRTGEGRRGGKGEREEWREKIQAQVLALLMDPSSCLLNLFPVVPSINPGCHGCRLCFSFHWSLERGGEGESPQSFSVYSSAPSFLCGAQHIENGYWACWGGARSPCDCSAGERTEKAELPGQPVPHCVTLR